MPQQSGTVSLSQIQDAESRLKTALHLGAKGVHIQKKMEPIFKSRKALGDSLPNQEITIIREIERLMEVINNERSILAEQRGTLKQERRAFDFERRTSQADIEDVNGLRDKLRDTEGRMRSLEQDLDKEKRRNSQGITPRPLSPVLHPAEKEQAIDMLNKATRELEKVTEERDTALLEAQRIAKDLKRKEEQAASLERESASRTAAAQEEIHELREKVKALTKASNTRDVSPRRHPITSTEGPPVVFIDPVLPSVSSSIATTPRSGDENDENDDRGTLEQLLDALTGRKEDETETQHLLHSLEHVTECLTERCRVLESALNDAKQELEWWRTGGGTSTFNEAYAKAMAENERHVRYEEQRHRKEKADLEKRVTESERKKGRYEELWRKSLQALMGKTDGYLLSVYFQAWAKHSLLENGNREIGRLNAAVISEKQKRSSQTPTILIQQYRSLQDENETLKRRVDEAEGELIRHKSLR